jgi:hypothetical protein
MLEKAKKDWRRFGKAKVSLWMAPPLRGEPLVRDALGLLPSEPGEELCGVILTRQIRLERLQEATHLLDSDLIYDIRFVEVVRAGKRRIAVFKVGP